ncbi:MAG: sarcosine oxidase subunit gamma family protein, partial [Woeseia sp.]
MVPELFSRRRGAFEAVAADLQAASGSELQLEALESPAAVNVRGLPGDADFLNAVEEAIGVSLPTSANRWNRGAGHDALWLGPDEWLVVGAAGGAREIENALLRAQPDNPWLSVVDLSHSYSRVCLSGPRARELLAKGCPLDLQPRAFGPGDCVQTVLAATRVLLRVLEDPPAI